MKKASMILDTTMIVSCSACMLDIIWNAVEDEYLTVIMYLLCSIPMRFSRKTSQMIHNGEAQAEIIGISTVLEPSVVRVMDIVSRELLCLSSQALGSLLLPVLEASLCSAHQSN